MAQKKLSLAAFSELHNGEVDEQFTQLQKSIIDDLENRPHIAKAREINIKLKYIPRMDGGALDDVKVIVDFGTKVPGYSSREYTMTPKTLNSERTLVFQPMSPENPNQMDITDKQQ